MPHRTFWLFLAPSGIAMLVFIALPIISVVVQSLHIENEKVLVVTESCGPFGCTEQIKIDEDASRQLDLERPLGRFNGLGTYFNRNHLASEELALAWRSRDNISGFISEIMNLPFYKALAFTLTYTFVTTPFVLILGFLLALAVNSLSDWIKGVVIFATLLPFIVTPLIGSLVLFWMIDADGIIGSTLQWLYDDPDLSLKASPALTWVTLIVYGVWHTTPFAFIVFYAGLQTVPGETLESAMIDGASRFQRTLYVTIPYLAPLVLFVVLIHLMDAFRVFEPIVGFSAEANATSLSWIIYNDLRQETKLFGSAAATSVLTILGISIILMPVVYRTWRDFKNN
jgi:ABC-type sugar transport system permease subunit